MNNLSNLSYDKDDALRKLNNLRTEMDCLKRDNDKLCNNIKFSDEYKENMNSNYECLKWDFEKVNKQLKEYMDELNSIKIDYNKRGDELSSVKFELDKAARGLNNKELMYSDIKDKLEEKTLRERELESLVESLKQEKNFIENRMVKDRESLMDELNALKMKLESSKYESANNTSAVKNKDDMLANNQRNIDGLNRELESLKRKFDTNEEELNCRITDCNNLSCELSCTKECSKQKDLDIEKLKELLKSKELEQEILSSASADTVNEYNKVKEYLRQRDLELDRVMTGNTDLKIENDRLNKYILDKGTEIDSLKRAGTDSDFETKFKDSEIERQRNEIKDKNLEMNNSKLAIVSLKNENREISDKLRFANNDYEATLQEIKRQEIDLKGLRDTLTNRDVNIGILKADIVKKDQEITTQQKNLSNMENKLNQTETDQDDTKRKFTDEKAHVRTSKNKSDDLVEQLDKQKKLNERNTKEIKKLNDTMKNWENNISNLSSSKQMVENELEKQKSHNFIRSQEMSNIKNKVEIAIKNSTENTPVKSRFTSPTKNYTEDGTMQLEYQVDRFLDRMLELEKTNRELQEKLKDNEYKPRNQQNQNENRLLNTPSNRYSTISPHKSITKRGASPIEVDDYYKNEFYEVYNQLTKVKQDHEKAMIQLAVCKFELERQSSKNLNNTSDPRTLASPRFAVPQE